MGKKFLQIHSYEEYLTNIAFLGNEKPTIGISYIRATGDDAGKFNTVRSAMFDSKGGLLSFVVYSNFKIDRPIASPVDIDKLKDETSEIQNSYNNTNLNNVSDAEEFIKSIFDFDSDKEKR